MPNVGNSIHLHGEVNKNNKIIELHTPITKTDRLTINAPTIICNQLPRAQTEIDTRLRNIPPSPFVIIFELHFNLIQLMRDGIVYLMDEMLAH